MADPQKRLFDVHHTEYGDRYVPCDRRVPPEAKPRLSRHCRLILERLRRGPATNDQLAKISRKYTSRISDLRKAGYTVTCVAQSHKTGESWYELDER